MALMRVFYQDWQMGCCGTPFSVGEEVAWRLVPLDGQQLRDGHCYGAEAWVENHGGPDRETAGRVRAIELVHREYTARLKPHALDPIDPEPGKPVFRPYPYTREPVPGAPTLEPVDTCPKWFEDEEPGPGPGPHRIRRTEGALITLEVLEARALPAREALDDLQDPASP
ncbi:DUF6578 domain-containing protein [Streptomyces sp. NK08204]|uniref:DUF6578 domain-containing protein n=1 Tax=Streptomyces sp. NK08204 TaxID=2873260 RepID=UPI001CEC2EBF|nr:DUF6578 domain-containing protein [Streptomyces sp. NK08204]